MRKVLSSLALMACLFGLLAATSRSDDSASEEQVPAVEAPSHADQAIDFTQDIRPILSDKCFSCHGPDEKGREGEIRFDARESAFGEGESGEIAIVPGDSGASEMMARILSDSEFDQMPPPEIDKPLTEEEKELLRRWIDQGAPWEEHWAYIAPVRPELPELENADWCVNEIDHFILDRLNREGLSPSPEADKETLIRRVTFDLTGLPPTLEEVDAYLADDASDAYEKLVDRLIASPRYGEHMARFWLDAARFSDTHGYHLDNYREMWIYRDWVVNAYNDNMPFSQFAIEQIGGDMLENATISQKIASGWNRCNPTTNEGGSIREEVHVRNVVDRVTTTGTVFMGTTFECSRCHDHKFDPYTMADFYSLFAFFNSIEMNPMDGNKKNHPPTLEVGSLEEMAEAEELEVKMEAAKEAIAAILDDYQYTDPMTLADVDPPEIHDVVWVEDEAPDGAKLSDWNPTSAPDPVYSGEKSLTLTADGIKQQYFRDASDPLDITAEDTLFAYVYLDPDNPPQQIMLQWNDGSWEHRAYWGANRINWGREDTGSRRRMGDLPPLGEWVRLTVPIDAVALSPGSSLNGWAFTQFAGTVYWDKAGIETSAPRKEYESFLEWTTHQHSRPSEGIPKNIANMLKRDPENRPRRHTQLLRRYFLENVYPETRDQVQDFNREVADLTERLRELKSDWATTLISHEADNPKPSYILTRGEYSQPQEEEMPRVTPAALPPLPEGAPRNRLGFAQWLVDPSHPLTARVQVNRFWQQLLGTGIVKTAGDFGSQGSPPTHPELLDWIAVEFRDEGWDVKSIMKLIVMSNTYRQSSHLTPEQYERDPENRLLARGARFRLDAEMIRDQALATSGLLVNQLGGPSVKPPQPDGLWHAVGYQNSNTVRFRPGSGPEEVHRRTLYTFIKRTAPPPQMGILDAPSREICSVSRERTNTPLQALMLMNDPQFVEAARILAERSIREGGDSPEEKIDYMYRLCTARHANDVRIAEQLSFYREMLSIYEAEPEEAAKLIAVGPTEANADIEPAELAAWTMVANIILNLDEVLNKN